MNIENGEANLILSTRNFINGHIKTYQEIIDCCTNTAKAKKDIVGEEYERFRKELIKSLGFRIGTKTDILYLSNNLFNPDQIILSPSGKLLALEEDKAHYVDKCFLSRAIINCARVVQKCLDSKIEVPYFILSCPTSYSKFEDEFSEGARLFRPEIAREMKKKFKYFSFCSHGRVTKSKYLKEGVQPFEYDPQLVQREINFWNSLQSQGV